MMNAAGSVSTPNLSPQRPPDDLSHSPNSTVSTHSPRKSYPAATPSQQLLFSEQQSSSGNDFPLSQYQNEDTYRDASDSTLAGANCTDNTLGISGDLQHCTRSLYVDRASQDTLDQRLHTSPSITTITATASSSLSSHPHSEQTFIPAPVVSHPSAPRYPAIPQNYEGHLLVGGAPTNLIGRFPLAPSPMSPIDVGTIIREPARSASVLNPTDLIQVQGPPPLVAIDTLLTSSQQSMTAEPLSQSPNPEFLRPQRRNVGMLYQAQNFTASGNFIDGNVGYITYNYTSSNQFMKELLEKTIPGAEFDSSDRDPPPRCHPGTRLAILGRCLYFVSNCDCVKKIRWVVGAAGVGKSAIMQNVAESPELAVDFHASVFFSVNGRNDGSKAVMTISYQFAAKSPLYRQVIEQEIARDPSLLRSSISKQFKKFITEPFSNNSQLKSARRVLVIIDGLDECHDTRIQQELLRLICDSCLTHPSSPLVWLIASRPEVHITSFFSRNHVIATYEKEEIQVDSNQARADVELYLRDKFVEIRDMFPSLDPQWPEERNFWKLAGAAGGLFAYARTVIRYISDPRVASPTSQFSDVLYIIDNHPMTDVSREEHPMALLDALYDRILSNVPAKIMFNTRKVLLALMLPWDSSLFFYDTSSNFIALCNWLGLTRGEAYAALNHLYSVLCVPQRDQAHREALRPFHKSFLDYISDFNRSRFSFDIEREGRQLMAQCAVRILMEASGGVSYAGVDYEFFHGTLSRGPGTGDKIPLTWLADEEVGWEDNRTRLTLYKLALGEVLTGIEDKNSTFRNEPYIRLLTTRFEEYNGGFPYSALCDAVFDKSRRSEFMAGGVLRETPLKIIDISRLNEHVDFQLQFRCPATSLTNLSSRWDDSCPHERKGQWKEGEDQEWSTRFDPRGSCNCFQRLKRQLEEWMTRSPDHIVLIPPSSTWDCCVEFRFIDPEDGISEWTYWFWCTIWSGQRMKYGIYA